MESIRKMAVVCGSETNESSKHYQFLCKAIASAVNNYLDDSGDEGVFIQIKCGSFVQKADKHERCRTSPEGKDEWSVEKRAEQYVAVNPRFSFDRLVLNQDTIEKILIAAELFNHYDLIFNKWGLKHNSPTPCVALNFYGKPGTGKTLAAHCLAHKLKKPLIEASYAQIESMYHGEGPKNVEAIFRAAEKQSAILFIDEADSLLSKRLTDVRQGSENAINSMRSQILICLEKFSGIVIFATNLVSNYDKAFESRVRSIEFKMPDKDCRERLWKMHLPPSFPIDSSVDAVALSELDDICGRDIRNAVQAVAEKMAVKGLGFATQQMLLDEVSAIKESRFSVHSEGNISEVKLTNDEKESLSKGFSAMLQKKHSVRDVTKAKGGSQ